MSENQKQDVFGDLTVVGELKVLSKKENGTVLRE